MPYLGRWDGILQEAIFYYVVVRVVANQVLKGQKLPITNVIVSADGVNAEVMHIAALGHVGEDVSAWSGLALPDQVTVGHPSTLEPCNCLLSADVAVVPPTQKETPAPITSATSVALVHG